MTCTYTLDITLGEGTSSGTYTGAEGDAKVEGKVLWGADCLPLGHKLFFPSSAHSVGWRGDGTAVYPGATPATKWDVAKNVNVRWKTAMPNLSNSQPIVVGNKVFTTAEPRHLICCDLKTGAILWKVDVDPILAAGATKEEAEAAQTVYPIFIQLREVALQYGVGSNRVQPLDKMREGWKQTRELLQKLQDAKFPGMTVRVPTQDEIDKETAITFEHSPINKTFRDPMDWFTRKYGFPLVETWPSVGGFTLATPVSDGTRVYVAMGQGQVAGYDLEGKLVWSRFHRPTGKSLCGFYPSPIILGDRLIVQHDGMMRAFATADGKTVWETPHAGPGRGYSMGTAHILYPDGKTPLLVTATGPVIRATDGKLLGTLGVSNCGSEWGGVSTLGDGKDTVYMMPGGNGEGDMFALRLTLKEGALEKQEVWKARHANRSITPVLLDGLIYHNQDDKTAIVRDAATGEVVRKNGLYTRFASFAIAGNSLFVPDGGGSTTVLTIGREAKIVSKNPMQEDVADKSCEVAPFFAGDAIVLRTHGYLYCFGTP
jgi:outer membrane protein assembly factor BamB